MNLTYSFFYQHKFPVMGNDDQIFQHNYCKLHNANKYNMKIINFTEHLKGR